MITFSKLGSYGRMGNQLFQMAATIGHALRNKNDYAFPTWSYMWDFNIPVTQFKKIIPGRKYEEPHYHHSPIPYWGNMDLHGYFQSEKYWQEFSPYIKQIFVPKHNMQRLAGTTAIHVRRGDYLIHKGCYEILGMTYYENAMSMANTSKYLVFSDDINWCKAHFIGNNFEFSEGNSAPIDLSIMRSCEKCIIANSSFSWWGAYLNGNAKQIIAPNKWFGPVLAKTHNTKDLIPNGWNLIDV